MKADLRPLLAGALLAFFSGCHIDILRSRTGVPLDREKFAALEPRKTTRGEVLEDLGAPQKVEWKSGKDYFWYLHRDRVDTGVRFQFPPFRTVAGYQHSFLRLNEASDDTNAMELVFGEDGVLERKSLRMSEAYNPPRQDTADWKLHLSAHGDYSLRLLGDGGLADYDRLFKSGYRVGLGLGWQPVPVCTLLARTSYQEHPGDSIENRGQEISVGDLHLYGFEIGVRLAAPLNLLWDFTDYENVKRVLFEDDLSRSTGFRFYLEGTTGVMLNSNVTVKINGTRAGNLYDNAYQFSGALEAGLEYGLKWGSAHIGITYQTLDPFDKGNTRLDDDAGAFQAVLLGGGIGVKF